MGAMRYLGIIEVKGRILCGYWVEQFFDLTGQGPRLPFGRLECHYEARTKGRSA